MKGKKPARKYGVRMQVYLPAQLARLLDEARGMHGLSPGEFVRQAIIDAIRKNRGLPASSP